MKEDIINQINKMYDEGFTIEEIADKLGENDCVQSFRECPEWCHEDADCNDCWIKCITLELDI